MVDSDTLKFYYVAVSNHQKIDNKAVNWLNGGSLWARLLELTLEQRTRSLLSWKAASPRSLRTKRAGGLRLRWSGLRRPASASWDKWRSVKPSRILRTPCIRSSVLWGAGLTKCPKK